MALSRRSGAKLAANIWPGFVDAMTALLLVIMFVLTIFMVIQFALRETITGQEETITGQEETIVGQETELSELSNQISSLADALGLERRRSAEMVSELGDTRAQLLQQSSLVSNLMSQRDAAEEQATSFEAQVAGLLAQNAELSAGSSDILSALDSEVSQREAAQLALAQARGQFDNEAEKARLASARADALQALVINLQDEAADANAAFVAMTEAEQARDAQASAADALRVELEGQAADTDAAVEALSAAEQARIAEAAAAEALRAKLQDSSAELTAMTLALEDQRRRAEETLTLLAAAEAAKDNLNNSQTENVEEISRQQVALAQANQLLSEEKEVSAGAFRELELLNQQTAALRQQLNSLQETLDASEAKDLAARVQLQTLGSDLNAALARVAAEQKARAELEATERERLEAEAVDLRSFRSEFFGRIQEVLAEREGVQVVGDRFVFSSEVLFAAGSAELGAGGRAQIAQVAALIREIADEIPDEINWVLRVDGHTDKVQLGSGSVFADNWELSQARALSVVKYLITQEGIPASRLAATGFGEFQPVNLGDSPEALAQNRRIELKLTEK